MKYIQVPDCGLERAMSNSISRSSLICLDLHGWWAQYTGSLFAVVLRFLQEEHDSNKVSAESAAVCRFVTFITTCSALGERLDIGAPWEALPRSESLF